MSLKQLYNKTISVRRVYNIIKGLLKKKNQRRTDRQEILSYVLTCTIP